MRKAFNLMSSLYFWIYEKNRQKAIRKQFPEINMYILNEHLESKRNFLSSSWAKAYIILYYRVGSNEREKLNLHSPERRCIVQEPFLRWSSFGTEHIPLQCYSSPLDFVYWLLPFDRPILDLLSGRLVT